MGRENCPYILTCCFHFKQIHHPSAWVMWSARLDIVPLKLAQIKLR